MPSKLVAVGLLVAGCVTAAAGGAYLAVRHNKAQDAAVVSETTAPAATQSPVAETEAAVSAPAAATETPSAEAVTAPAPPAPAAEPARTDPAAPAMRKTRPAATARTTTRTYGAPSSDRHEQRGTSAAAGQTAAATAPAATKAPETTPPAQPGETVPETETRAAEPQAPPAPQFEEVILPASSVIGLEVETPLSSERSRVEDRVDARVTRDVMSAGRVAIPAGSRVVGSVTLVERGGKLKDRARLGVRFHTLVVDGREVPIRSETIFREGDSPTGEGARKIGGAAIGGAILGGILGGGKGAMIGGATGAAGGTAVVMAGDRNAATLPSGTVVTVRLAAPATIEIEKK